MNEEKPQWRKDVDSSQVGPIEAIVNAAKETPSIAKELVGDLFSAARSEARHLLAKRAELEIAKLKEESHEDALHLEARHTELVNNVESAMDALTDFEVKELGIKSE